MPSVLHNIIRHFYEVITIYSSLTCSCIVVHLSLPQGKG